MPSRRTAQIGSFVAARDSADLRRPEVSALLSRYPSIGVPTIRGELIFCLLEPETPPGEEMHGGYREQNNRTIVKNIVDQVLGFHRVWGKLLNCLQGVAQGPHAACYTVKLSED